jgi:hypothetical protein
MIEPTRVCTWASNSIRFTGQYTDPALGAVALRAGGSSDVAGEDARCAKSLVPVA